jgi:hypothetical protein
MAIIYTYPTVTPTVADKVLISSNGTNATANATISSIKDTINVVDSLIAGDGISVSSATGDVTVSNTGVLSVDNSFGTFISGIANTNATGNIRIGTIDLSATGTPSSTNFLKGDNTWSSVDLTADVTGILPISSGGTGAGNATDGLNNLLPNQSGNSGKVLSTDGARPGWIDAADASGSQGSVQFNNNGNFLGTDKFLYSESTSENLLEIKGITDPIANEFKNAKIKLGGTAGGPGGNPASAGGEIELQAGGLAIGDNSVTIAAPRSSILSAYSIKLPTSPPTSNNRILESDSAGNLSWIDTPSGTAAGGSNTQMQYNNSGAFGGTTGLTWDDTANVLSIDTRYEGDIDGALLQQVLVTEPGGVSKGDVVYISGGTGDNPEVRKAQANSVSTMSALGIMKDNTAGLAIGECVTSGEITGLDLTGFTTGDELFVSNTTAGELLTSAPTGEANLIQKIGKVIKGGNGGALTVLGAFRTNATPNLDQGSIFIGDASDQATTLGVGASDTVLTSDGTTASWETPKISAGTKTATSLGKAGELSFDSLYMYVCVGTNQWRRIQLDFIP